MENLVLKIFNLTTSRKKKRNETYDIREQLISRMLKPRSTIFQEREGGRLTALLLGPYLIISVNIVAGLYR